MKHAAMVALGGVVAVALTACGSSTVTDDAAESSVAPLTRSARPSASNSSTGEQSSSEAPNASPQDPQERQPSDQAAEEVSEIPDPQLQLTDSDQDYLTLLKDGGIDVAGAESQMIGAAEVVCDDQFPSAVHAVAGQLVEQQRTNLSVDEVVGLIDSSARQSYCS